MEERREINGTQSLLGYILSTKHKTKVSASRIEINLNFKSFRTAVPQITWFLTQKTSSRFLWDLFCKG